jgi:hypothetical protein
VNARRDAYNCASRVNAGFTLGCQIAARGTSRTLISYVQHRLNRLRAEQVDYLLQQAVRADSAVCVYCHRTAGARSGWFGGEQLHRRCVQRGPGGSVGGPIVGEDLRQDVSVGSASPC